MSASLKVNTGEGKSKNDYALPFGVKTDGIEDERGVVVSMAVARIALTTVGEQLFQAAEYLADFAAENKLPDNALLRGEFGKGADGRYTFSITVAEVKAFVKVAMKFREVRSSLNIVQTAGSKKERKQAARKVAELKPLNLPTA